MTIRNFQRPTTCHWPEIFNFGMKYFILTTYTVLSTASFTMLNDCRRWNKWYMLSYLKGGFLDSLCSSSECSSDNWSFFSSPEVLEVRELDPQSWLRRAQKVQLSPQVNFRAVEGLSGQVSCSRGVSFNTQDWTGERAALWDASTSLCGSGQKHALVCAPGSVCECVNVSECVSQCLVYKHNDPLFCCSLLLAPPSPVAPHLTIHPTQQPILSSFSSFALLFLDVRHSFHLPFSLLLNVLWLWLKFFIEEGHRVLYVVPPLM